MGSGHCLVVKYCLLCYSNLSFMFLLVSLSFKVCWCISILALALCADHQMSKTELGNLTCLFPQEDREKRPVQMLGLQCAEKKSNADCYIGTVHFLFHSFFVWYIDALTQYILNNMNKCYFINMCSQTLINTLKEQLCEFAKRVFTNMYTTKKIRLKLSVFHFYSNAFANSKTWW